MAPVSSKEILKARRMAKRIRASVACARCRYAKGKCSDFRPCKNCVALGVACNEANSKMQTSQHASDPNAFCMDSAPCASWFSGHVQAFVDRPLDQSYRAGKTYYDNTNSTGAERGACPQTSAISASLWGQYMAAPVNFDQFRNVPTDVHNSSKWQQRNSIPPLFESGRLPALAWQQPSQLVPVTAYARPIDSACLLQAAVASSAHPLLSPAVTLPLLLALTAVGPLSI